MNDWGTKWEREDVGYRTSQRHNATMYIVKLSQSNVDPFIWPILPFFIAQVYTFQNPTMWSNGKQSGSNLTTIEGNNNKSFAGNWEVEHCM